MLRERDLIDLIRQGRAGAAPRAGDLGIGDDCAVLSAGGRRLLITIDLMAEGIHFDLGYTPPYLLGRKAVAAAVSDIAAMGGVPRALFVSVSLPRSKQAGFARALAEGVHEEALAAGAAVLGGDTTASTGPVVIDVAAVGEARRAGPILRSGARTGDRIYVSGLLGGSAAGRELLRQGFDPFSARAWAASGREKRIAAFLAAMAHLLPRPRLALGQALAGVRTASAMIDLSDGLSTDLHNLCDASRVGAVIESGRVPLHPALLVLAGGGSGRRKSPARRGRYRSGAPWPLLDSPGGRAKAVERALSGGEDYELLFTVPAAAEGRLARLASRLVIPVTRIGRIVPRSRGVTLIGPGGGARPLPRSGWEHFRR